MLPLSPLAKGLATPVQSCRGSLQSAQPSAKSTEIPAGLRRPAVGTFLRELPASLDFSGCRNQRMVWKPRVPDRIQRLFFCGITNRSLPSVGLGFPLSRGLHPGMPTLGTYKEAQVPWWRCHEVTWLTSPAGLSEDSHPQPQDRWLTADSGPQPLSLPAEIPDTDRDKSTPLSPV